MTGHSADWWVGYLYEALRTIADGRTHDPQALAIVVLERYDTERPAAEVTR